MKGQAVAFLGLILLGVGTTGHQLMASSRKQASTKQNAPQVNGVAPAVDTSAWKTYRNEKHGFEVRYPETWRVNAGSGTGPDMITIAKPLRNGEPNASLTLAVQKNQKPKEVFHRAMVCGADEADERTSRVEWERCDWRTARCLHGKHRQLWETARYVHVTESDGCIVAELQTPDGIGCDVRGDCGFVPHLEVKTTC
jgi:hypothetical protein